MIVGSERLSGRNEESMFDAVVLFSVSINANFFARNKGIGVGVPNPTQTKFLIISRGQSRAVGAMTPLAKRSGSFLEVTDLFNW